ncbi:MULTISPECIES: nucleotidyltransferase domain-containing protein [unclassified Clostridium]|uniref:nucleotidyltransferase domain-containing protein n=1 Tax=unclassified Clostridium TaxID=2614128 RepID=UPI00207AEFC8|nr:MULTISPECIES: nucleotidyltransferase domain-containing protein [unclassified Clostridium]
MYGINEKVYNNLLVYFEKEKDINKVILFGSRAKGNARINSDIDLCIDCSKKVRYKIVENIDDIIGIYSSDILFSDSLNLEVKEQIDKYGIEIYSI